MSEDQLHIGGQEISITDLAGLNTADIAPQFRTKLPKGVYIFEVTSAKLDTRISTKPETRDQKYPIINVECTVVAVVNLADQSIEPESLIGKKQYETWNLSTESQEKFVASLGFWIGFAQLTGFMQNGGLDEMLQAWIGTRFRAPITHRRNDNDLDDPYVNMNRDKVVPEPVEQLQETVQEAASVQTEQTAQPLAG